VQRTKWIDETVLLPPPRVSHRLQTDRAQNSSSYTPTPGQLSTKPLRNLFQRPLGESGGAGRIGVRHFTCEEVLQQGAAFRRREGLSPANGALLRHGAGQALSALVLADTFSPEILDWRERLQFLVLKSTIPPVRLVGYERVERVMVWLQERIQGKGVSGDYEKIERLQEEAPRMATDEFAKVIHALTDFHETELDLSAVTAPTLVLYGEHDAGFIRRHAPKLAESIPNATLREVPEGGHASNLDNPEFFTAVLREFLAQYHSPETSNHNGEDGGRGE
jgi:pimeloyl-ACP methyl ester carboxylesterase